MAAAEVFGVVLTGGRSVRMGQDKALLNYSGRAQIDVCYALLSDVCADVLISVRPDQSRGAPHAIRDLHGSVGPMDGVLSALTHFPDRACLAVACDMPFLNRATLEHLLAARDPEQQATVYRRLQDGGPEPLCAIYEPSIRAELFAALRAGDYSLRRVLERVSVRWVDLPDSRALDNVNDPIAFEAARKALQ